MLEPKDTRVLVVEDDSLVCEMIQALLEETGYCVAGTAADGEVAIDRARELRPDVILMDIRLPGIDGLEATRRIFEERPTPVVLLTAYDTPELLQRASAVGAGAYLVKPSDVREIERAIAISIARFDDIVKLKQVNEELRREVAERRRAEEAARASEAQYRTLIESIDDAIHAKDTEGRYVTVNREAARRAGRPPEDIIGKTSWDIYPEETAQVFTEEDAQLYRTERALDVECEFMTAEGPMIRQVRKTPLRDCDGKIVGLVSVSRDVTERRKVEMKIRENAARSDAIAAMSRLLSEVKVDYEVALNTIARQVAEMVGDCCLIRLTSREERWHDLRAVYHRDPEADLLARRSVADMPAEMLGMLSAMARQMEEPVFVPRVDMRQLPPPLDAVNMEHIRARGVSSLMIAPLRVSGSTLGLVHVTRDRDRPAYDADDLRFVCQIADRVAVSIANTQLFEALERELGERRRAEHQLRQAMEATVQLVAVTTEVRDPYTAGHQRRVGMLARAIAEDMGLSKENAQWIQMAANIHDIGKISVPFEILSKPGALSPMEMALAKNHSQIGYDIIKDVPFTWPVAQIILQHHERWDGSGYPMGLRGEEICLEARIVGVADVVEAMAFHRPYRPALGLDMALQEVSRHRGTRYDPAVVDICLELFNSKRFTFEPQRWQPVM